MRLFRLFVRIAISGVALVVFILHIAGSPRLEIIDRVENYLYDVRIRLTMPGTLDDRIVIVDIDEASQLELGQWPWPRDTLATIVDNLFDHYGVIVLGFDALFAEAEETSAERLLDTFARSEFAAEPEFAAKLLELRDIADSNVRFAESLIARNVVTGFVFKDFVGPDEPEVTGLLPAPLIPAKDLVDVTVPFVQAKGYAGTLDALQQNAFSGGFFDSPLIDSDGVFRRAPLVQQYGGDLYASLALAVARVALGTPPVGLRFASGSGGSFAGIDLEALRLGDRDIPVSEQAAVFIPFRGPQGSFAFVSAKTVFDASAPLEQLEGKIVLLGASAAGLLDLRSTPVGQRYIGVEAHANLIAGLLDGEIRQQPSYADGLELFLLALIAVLTVTVLPRLAPLTALGFVLAVLLAAIGMNLWMWTSLGLVVPLASLLGFTLIAGLLQINYGFFIESRNKRHLSRIFGQYIPPSLVEELDESGQEASLEGETRHMSVLFSDVRGFTTLSENLDARELTALMNEFLTPITRVIQEHRGTIDKYMGDAVMAFWGAPLVDEEHARHAVQAGLRMIAAVRELRSEFERRGWPPIAVGVGVASGEMNVGNMGSAFRIAYTVMGDVVNLGSRLEGLTKQYGVDMIVSDGTMRQLPDFVFRELDLVRVKGKQEPIAIHEPIAPVSMVTEAKARRLRQFSSAISAYRCQEWDAAQGLLDKLRQERDELLYNVYLKRIEEFRRSPPPSGWDGVFDHLNK